MSVEVTKVTEQRGPGLFIVSEGNGSISREEVTVLQGEDLEPGTVLGKVTASGKYVQVDLAAVDGSEVADAVLYRKTDATDADKVEVVIKRLAEVLQSELVYPDGADANDIATINGQLADLNIIVRQ